ncbi:sensor histidine kinase [Streptomyces sp. NPDC001858]
MRLTLLVGLVALSCLSASALALAMVIRASSLRIATHDAQSNFWLGPSPGAWSDAPCTRDSVAEAEAATRRDELDDHPYTCTYLPENGAKAVQPQENTGELSLLPWTDPAHVHPLILVNDPGLPPGSVIIHSLSSWQERQNTFGRLLLGSTLGLTLLISGGTRWVVGRALDPVEAIRAEFAKLSAQRLDRRVPVPRAGTEVARLAGTMNSTLDRLQTAVDQQRRFTADAAHELRTPLACLRTELELALNRPDIADWPRVVRDAHGDSIRLQDLTEDLLLLARLDAEDADRGPDGSVDLTDVVREETVRRRPRGLTIDLHTEPGPVTVRGRPALLARVLGNLLDNAERHAARTITVRLTHDTEHREAVLDVQDDGPGIPPEDQQRIFDRFTRLDDARARDSGGVGLGLAIARSIALAHHGTLEITPSARGAHFTLRLPTGLSYSDIGI